MHYCFGTCIFTSRTCIITFSTCIIASRPAFFYYLNALFDCINFHFWVDPFFKFTFHNTCSLKILHIHRYIFWLTWLHSIIHPCVSGFLIQTFCIDGVGILTLSSPSRVPFIIWAFGSWYWTQSCLGPNICLDWKFCWFQSFWYKISFRQKNIFQPLVTISHK